MFKKNTKRMADASKKLDELIVRITADQPPPCKLPPVERPNPPRSFLPAQSTFHRF